MGEFKVEKWMKIAEKYGAIFKNITFERDENDFVKGIAKNPYESFYIEVGFPILQYAEDIIITDDNHEVKKDKVIYNDLRDMLNEYLNFILNNNRIEWLKTLIDEFNKLPRDLKFKLRNAGLLFNLFGEKDKSAIKHMLLQARTINFKGKPVFMPFIDFLNHDFREGISFNITEKSVIVKGFPSKSGEIFAIYNLTDDFSFLNTYFFTPGNPFAYSITIRLEMDDGKILTIGRQIAKVKQIQNGLRIPEYIVTSNSIELSHLWIGSIYTPRRPFWSFKMLWENFLGRKDTLKVYSLIKSFNLRFLITLLQEVDKLPESKAKNLLKRATLNQIKCISYSFEEP